MTSDPFADLVGNEKIKGYLKTMAEKNAVANSLLFIGPPGIGKGLFAKAFAELLFTREDPTGPHRYKIANNIHPDLFTYYPEGKTGMHAIDTIRAFNEQASLPPLAVSKRVFIIHDADRMLTYGSNALLKTFEEPLPTSVIILLTSEPQKLLATVRSRCRSVYFQAIEQQALERLLQSCCHLNLEQARPIARLARGSAVEALRLCRHGEKKGHGLLLYGLMHATTLTYGEMVALIKKIAETMEQEKKEIEKQAREQLGLASRSSDLPTAQRHQLEREVEGKVATRQSEEAYMLFDIVIQWIRDLHLVLLGGNPEELFHKDYFATLEEAVQRGNLPSLEEALCALCDVRLALERSTAFSLCLEQLLLRTGLFA